MNQIAEKAPAQRSVGNFRWGIVALLFAAIAINYTHRQMLGLFKPTLEAELHWNEESYAALVFWFQVAYAIGQFGFGRFLDKIGVRWGYAIAYSIWTLAHMATGFVGTAMQFTVARFTLGLGEAGSFPASLKAIAEWFPQKERALAAGIFNSGTSIGVMIAAAGVPFIALDSFHIPGIAAELHGLGWGWRGAFVSTGAASFLWLAAWLLMYRAPARHPKLNPGELAYIQQDVPDTVESLPLRQLIGKKETWIYALTKFMTDPIWWLYLFWLPDFLHKSYGLNIGAFGPPLIAIYLMADFGSVAGGWMSSTLIARGVSVNFARKTTLLLFALCAVPMVFVQNVQDLWSCVFLIGLAAAGHQAFSCNVYTIPSDLFPRSAVGTVLGIGGAAGAVGGMLMSLFVGFILQTTHSYALIFGIAAFTYLVAATLIHLLAPRYKRAEITHE